MKDRRTRAELLTEIERLDDKVDNALRISNFMTRKYHAVLDEARRHANIEDNLRSENAGMTKALTALGEGLGR